MVDKMTEQDLVEAQKKLARKQQSDLQELAKPIMARFPHVAIVAIGEGGQTWFVNGDFNQLICALEVAKLEMLLMKRVGNLNNGTV